MHLTELIQAFLNTEIHESVQSVIMKELLIVSSQIRGNRLVEYFNAIVELQVSLKEKSNDIMVGGSLLQ